MSYFKVNFITEKVIDMKKKFKMSYRYLLDFHQSNILLRIVTWLKVDLF